MITLQLGFVSAILPDLSLEQVFDFAAEQRFGCVELMCWPRGRAERRYAGVTHVDVGAGAPELDRVRSVCAAHPSVGVSGLGYYPNLLSGNAAEAKTCLEHLKKVIRAASSLDIAVVNTFVGRDLTKSVDDNWPAFRKVWKPLIRFAEDHHVRIGIENCPMLFTWDEWPGGKNLATSPTNWRRMFEEIPSPNFGLNLDPSHLLWQQIDAARALREFKDRLVHVHAKDARVDREGLYQHGVLGTPLLWHTPKLPGLGDVSWGEFFSALTDTGYAGAVCIEVEDRAYEGSLENRKRALVQSKRFLEQYAS